MAVGLASYYIASAFNELATGLTEASIYALPATLIVLLLAHALNIGLCLVAIFAHGVRLNMLEFSTNAGVQWVGYPYQPFAVRTSPDEGDA
jgi:V/A-type H+-transporting ATPase subunit I